MRLMVMVAERVELGGGNLVFGVNRTALACRRLDVIEHTL